MTESAVSVNDETSIEVSDEDVPEGARVMYSKGKRFLLRQENFEDDEDWHADFAERYSDFQRRELQNQNIVHDVDYDDVHYRPYEWMIKVGTEYYYRYEGTQVVPPCMEVVHWRIMKDPIRVHPRQIVELNRLLAHRRAPKGQLNECKIDTAGILQGDNNEKVKLNRDIQYTHKGHRMVFCECQDWPSVFDGDQQWCKKWMNDTDYSRLDKPYNFPTDGW